VALIGVPHIVHSLRDSFVRLHHDIHEEVTRAVGVEEVHTHLTAHTVGTEGEVRVEGVKTLLCASEAHIGASRGGLAEVQKLMPLATAVGAGVGVVPLHEVSDEVGVVAVEVLEVEVLEAHWITP